MSCCPKKPGPPLTQDENPSEEDIARFGCETVACVGCGAEIYDEADWCHKCGRAQRAAGDSDDGESGAAAGIPVWAMVTAGVVVGGVLIAALGLM